MKKLSNLNGNFEYELLDENQQVADLREKLALLYESPFSDILWWELRDNSLVSDGYYKLFYYEQSVLKHIILFKYSAKSEKKISVINNWFKIFVKDIQNICYILFNEFDKLQIIFFERLFTNPEKMPKMIFDEGRLGAKTMWLGNDIIIPLPESMDAYLKSLSKNTREIISKKRNRIVRVFPDFKVNNFEKSDISFELIEELFALKQKKMIVCGIVPAYSANESRYLYEYFSNSGLGFLSICTIDNKMVSGMTITVFGEHAYAHIIAHDLSFEKYSAGEIALFNAIKYLIEVKKVKYCHMLDGRQRYKYQHGGIDHNSYYVHVFRNKGINYYIVKIKTTVRKIRNYVDNYFYQRLRNNKIIYNLYRKLKKTIRK